MEQFDLTEQEWLELYRFVLERLEKLSYTDIRREIETAAAAPILEEGSEEEKARIFREFKNEVGRRTVRGKSPFEAFSVARDVLWARLIELPEVASAIAKTLSDGRRVEFRVDYAQQYAPTQSEPFSLADLMLDDIDKRKALDSFLVLGIELSAHR